MDILHASIPDLADAVAKGDLTAEVLCSQYLERLRRYEPALRAFAHFSEPAVLEQARAIDEKRRRGDKLGALAGVPIALKDALCTRGFPTTCASKILFRDGQPWLPPYDATVVQRLRAADAVIFGKTNQDEFAMGSSTENSALHPTMNPWDTSRVPGGSSGGSAVAVAARLCAGALGSDTGGSIRQPAALTHTVGLKPSYGRVSRYGLVAFASSLDQIGPLANDVRGCARLLTTIAGLDPKDQTSAPLPVDDLESSCGLPVAGLRIGVPSEYFSQGIHPQVEASVRRALEALRSSGCELVPVSLPHTPYAIATYYVIATAEASSNLARFDGVRYGLRVLPEHGGLADMYAATRGSGFGPEVKRRIMLGTYVLSAGYYEAYYLKAQKVRTLLRRDFEQAFQNVDVIATPTSPSPAWKLGEKLDDPLAMYLADAYTLPASLAGIAGISVPCEPLPPNGSEPALPVGLQLLAPAFQEATLCRIASAWEALNPSRAMLPACTP